MKLLILTLWISSLISVHCQVYTMTLNGEWNGTIDTCRKQKSLEDCSNGPPILQSFNATVPGGIYTDLHRNGIIEDNLFGKNDVNNRWVGNQTVVYSKIFNVSSDFVNDRMTFLIFYGIDTFANITLNDQSIFPRPSNMFLTYLINVAGFIKEGQNLLQVTFRSAVKEAEYLYNDQNETYKYIVPPVCVPEEYNGQCHVNHIRKMQASFSWDWGPAFPSMGIWRDVELVSTYSVKYIWIYDVTTDIRRKENTWNILITIFTTMSLFVDCHVASILYIPKGKLISNATDGTCGWPNNQINISLIVPADAVENWWPNGYGDQRLYNLSIIMATEHNIAHKQIRVGFRTVELVEEPLEKGLSFYFRVNGVPIFAKGSNFIPASVFPELSAKEDTIRHLLLSAKEANMNMLRVWGGGVYQSELFYDLADEYGIMIWQDFMFASAMYPTSGDFLDNVRQEVEQNVMRLKKHPSIVLWAGNNENEAALFGNWYGTGSAEIYREDYVKLYVDLLKTEVEELDPVRPFLVSSPGNGALEETYNYTGVDPSSNIYGDINYFNYSRDGWDITQYPRPRFCSKYGFQSWPSMYTLTTVVGNATADLHVNSDFVKHRQHMPLGNQYMQSLISRNFIIPQSNDSVRDFANYVYLSQINQAVSMRIQTESYRQAKSEVNSVGEGRTMGALYWQLNDVWQAPTWSSIDVEGRWKMLHYYAKDFFDPLIITSHLSTSNRLSIYIVSDELRSRSNVTVGIHYYNWKSITSLSTRFLNINIEANNATRVTSFQLDESLDQVGCGSWEAAKRSCIVTLSLEEDHQLKAPVHYVYPGPLKNADIPVANVTVKVRSKINITDSPYENFELVLSTDNIALFVWLETGIIRGHFSENGFHMFELEKSITFHAYEETTIELLQKYTTLKTLSDIYNPRDNFDDDYSVLEKQKNSY